MQRIIAGAETSFIWALFDRDRAALVSRARYPARRRFRVAGAVDPETALRHHERLPRVTRQQNVSRANKACYHMRDGPDSRRVTPNGRGRAPAATRWLDDFDASALELASR